ncbi:2-phosphosulfolactate phosphatase [Rhodococcus aerolatus]
MRVHPEWGPAGATVPAGTVAVVVDVLSFTTAVSVAVDRGVEVLPHPADGDAAGLAEREDAVLARPRGSAGPTLSPVALRRVDPAPARLVLPSPNGSRVSHQLADSGADVVAACLRNAAAVATWVAATHPGAAVALVPAGERWPDGSLRPAVEDLWGAGAVAHHLATAGPVDLTPEAAAAAAAWRAVRGAAAEALHGCVSGLELAAGGHAGDVDVAAEVGASALVPVLVHGRFRGTAA